LRRDTDEPAGKLENLWFAQAMLRELRQLMKADGEHLLTYLLDMAYLEVSDAARASWLVREKQGELTSSPHRKAARFER